MSHHFRDVVVFSIDIQVLFQIIKMTGRIRLLSARALASAVQIAVVVNIMMAPISAMTLFQALANKVKQIDPGASSLT